MHLFGFSTGALAFGDFKLALRVLAGSAAKAVELSALRDHELLGLMESLERLDLSAYDYVSVHAPSRFSTLRESQAADLLKGCIERNWPIILHPDAISDEASWDGFGSLLCIENMDKRKRTGRTPDELEPWFDRYPEASFCLDLGHAKQVDPSLTIAHELISRFGDRLRQIHLSELSADCKHKPLSVATVVAVRELAYRIRPTAVILESVVEHSQIALELQIAGAALEHREEVEERKLVPVLAG